MEKQLKEIIEYAGYNWDSTVIRDLRDTEARPLGKFTVMGFLLSEPFLKAYFGEEIPEKDIARYSLDIHYYSQGSSRFLKNWEYHATKLVLLPDKEKIEYLIKFISK